MHSTMSCNWRDIPIYYTWSKGPWRVLFSAPNLLFQRQRRKNTPRKFPPARYLRPPRLLRGTFDVSLLTIDNGVFEAVHRAPCLARLSPVRFGSKKHRPACSVRVLPLFWRGRSVFCPWIWFQEDIVYNCNYIKLQQWGTILSSEWDSRFETLWQVKWFIRCPPFISI